MNKKIRPRSGKGGVGWFSRPENNIVRCHLDRKPEPSFVTESCEVRLLPPRYADRGGNGLTTHSRSAAVARIV